MYPECARGPPCPSNWFAPIASTLPLMEGSILEDCHPRLIPHRSPSVILNVMADLGLLLLVLGRRPHLLKLPLGREPSVVPLLSLVPLPLCLLYRSTLNP